MDKFAKNICLINQLKLLLLNYVEGESEHERERERDLMFYTIAYQSL